VVEKVPLTHPPPYDKISCRLGPGEPGFREDLYSARELRGDFTFGEQILDIADDGPNDWIEAKNGGAPRVNKEVVLRSKLRIEARQFHMSHLHSQQWGEKQTIDIKSDWALLSEDERRRKADELIAMIRELKEPPMQPRRWSIAGKRRRTSH
jgi:antitoxin component of MazEF toxin-antitoxin module